MNSEDRDLIPIQNGPIDIRVMGNSHSPPPMRVAIVDVMISYDPEDQGDNARNMAAYLKEKGLSVYLVGAEDIITYREVEGMGVTGPNIADYARYCAAFVMLLDVPWTKSKEVSTSTANQPWST